MREHLAQIQRDQILVAHPAVLLPLVALHLHDHQVLSHLDQIAIAVVKIFRRAVVLLIAQGQLVRYRRGVKPVIHAGFVPSR